MAKKSLKNNLATKSDIGNLRTEFKRTEKSLRIEILKVEERVEKLDEKLDGKFDTVMTKVDEIDERTKKMDATLNNLRNTLDGFVGGIDALKDENSVGTKHTRELRVQVDNHEERITTLESI